MTSVTEPSQTNRLPAAYLLVQSLLGAVWWILLFLRPSTRRVFVPEQFLDAVLLSLAAADVALFVLGSLFAGLALLWNWKHSRAICLIVLGAVTYATLMCLGWFAITGQPIVSVICMMLATAGTAWACGPAR